MATLTRIFRFSPGRSGEEYANGFAGSPRIRSLERYFEMRVRCRGEVDPSTSYLLDIKRIDRAMEKIVLPPVTQALATHGDHADPVALLRSVIAPLNDELSGLLASLRWQLSPTYSLEMETSDMSQVLIRQWFDFAAAHRLHNPALSVEENVRLYGKCNNPNGHGHNYRFEPCVAMPTDAKGGEVFTLAMLEECSKRVLLDRFDHKHLNEDTLEFKQPGGVNPSVENIAKVFFDLLGPEITRKCAKAKLASMTVWETDRTSSTYPA
ncbi:MAG: 6-carboxytetrahydropterin synthase [Phycisphaerales bacterium]